MPRQFLRYAAGCAAAFALLALPRAAGAQQFRFQNVPWGITADSVRPRMEALGFRHVRTYENGDMRFRSDADVVIGAAMEMGKLVHIVESHPLVSGSLDARFSAVVDSLKQVYGTPDDTRPLAALWQRGFTYLQLHADSARGSEPAGIRFWWRGPGGDAAAMRRAGEGDSFAPLDSAWLVLVSMPERRLAIETASISRRADGSYRTRIRIDHAQMQHDPTGSFDALIYGYDVDCAGNRLQMRSRTAFVRGRQVRSDGGATVWVPTRQGTMQREVVRLVCEYVRRR